MELTAAIEGLKALKRPCKVTLFSDSRYLVDTMSRSWRRNANHDLWEELDKLVETHEVSWWWLSRNSTPELAECDRVAKEQSQIVS
jgi:ribonuclease HI